MRLMGLAVLIAGVLLLGPQARAAAPAEYQVKAVFLFNFSQFVTWPPSAFTDADAPFVIGVFGQDPFGSYLDEVVRGESVNGRPLLVRHIRSAAAAGDCQIVFIPKSEGAQLEAVLANLANRSTLTVSDLDESAQRGAMIRLVTDRKRIRLRVNVDAARAGGLTISSKLLRAAEIVDPKPGRGG